LLNGKNSIITYVASKVAITIEFLVLADNLLAIE